MNEQPILLFFIILSIGIMIYLDVWKSKKAKVYKNDERWQLIKNKANDVANQSHYVVILLLAILQTISINHDLNITITLNRLMTYGMYFIGLRKLLELLALKYFDNQI
ncbi:hypothetical protein [Faecalimicrobium sp. JNUCC 81]